MLFGSGRSPLFRFYYKNKISYLFGSNHAVPLFKLKYRTPIDLIFGRPDPSIGIYDKLINRQTLVTEQCCLDGQSYLDSADKVNVDAKLDKLIEIVNDGNMYSRLINLHELCDDIDVADFRRRYIRKFYQFRLSPKDELLFRCFEKVITMQPYNEIFDTVNDINWDYIMLCIYRAIVAVGIDCNLNAIYMKAGKPVYSLDYPTGNEVELSINVSLRNKIQMLIAKLRNRDFIERTLESATNRYLYDEFSDKVESHEYTDSLVVSRNNKWVPWILRYHNETSDPLIVMGEDHLKGEFGVVNLLRKQVGEQNCKFEVYHVGIGRFV